MSRRREGRSVIRSLLKKSPGELIRFLTVDQWRAIDREYLGTGDDESSAKKKSKSKKGKGATTPAPVRYSLRALIAGVLVSIGLSLAVYGADYQDRRLWVGWHFLGYLLPMLIVLLAHPRPPTGSRANIGKILWLPLIAIVLVAVSLTAQELYGERAVFARLFDHRRSEYYELHSFAWWTGWRFAGYLVFPVLIVLALPGYRLREMFIDTSNFRRHLWIYLGLFLLVLPAVLIAAQTKSFKLTYPFYKLANRSSLDFWAWQGLYWLQFISLEFFFRGFILRVLAPRFGSTAIFVMIVPYCMIHFGKPLSETLGAIIAGLVLGTLAMRTRSIWGGAFIHIAVALTMDSLAVADCPSAETGLRCPSH